jgi:uncharacterized protein (TIGR02271 family)
MAQQTIVGVYDNASTAQQAAQEVIAAGIGRSRVRLSAEANTTVTTSGSDAEDKGFWASMKDAFGFGDDDDDQYGYREASRRGGTVVSVDAEDNQTDTVCKILEQHGPANLDQKAEQWKSEGWSGYDKYKTAFASGAGTGAAQATTTGGATARTEVTATRQAAAKPAAPPAAAATRATAADQQAAIPIVEEKLNVGKQVVTRGGVRIHSRIVERPVEAQVNLREEHVKVERHAVDRPLTGAEAAAAFQEQTITATEKAERAVVSKQARVVEEVEIGKTATERTETVRDTVRRTDVDVQRVDEGDARFRPAYQFADELAANAQYRGRTFDTFEADARRSFEQRHPNSKWDEFKDAIRTRYDRARSKT